MLNSCYHQRPLTRREKWLLFFTALWVFVGFLTIISGCDPRITIDCPIGDIVTATVTNYVTYNNTCTTCLKYDHIRDSCITSRLYSCVNVYVEFHYRDYCFRQTVDSESNFDLAMNKTTS